VTPVRWARWRNAEWRGWVDPAAEATVATCLASLAGGAARASRHAETRRVATGIGVMFVKTYPAPGGWRAGRAFRMGRALARAGFGTPPVVAVARRGGAGLLVTRDVGGEELAAAVTRRRLVPAAKRRLLEAVGTEVGRLHGAGFVHGDLVPPNVLVVGEEGIVFLDNDRTRRGRLLVWLAGRRNLVQLGRFVVPGLTLADRGRVLAAYARARRISRRGRRRLARWVVRKTVERRCAIDHVPPAVAARAGFREFMRAGGPFDPRAAAADATTGRAS
jgi:hypothetical protein